MVATPLLILTAKKQSLSISISIATIGLCLLFFSNTDIRLLAIIFISIGISISGYLIRFEAAETPSGAAYNKIAVNIGSVLSGLFLYFSIKNQTAFLLISIIIFVFIILLTINRTKHSIHTIQNNKFSRDPRIILGWIFLGISIGIKMYSLYSLLPQYLLSQLKILPTWYGFLITINGLVIIFLQLPIMQLITRSATNNGPLKITFTIMGSGMLLITALYLPIFTNIIILCVWVILLSLVECAVSYLDVAGVKMNSLFIKELFIGVGGGICVLCGRLFSVHVASLMTGTIGLITMGIAILFLFPQLGGYGHRPPKQTL
ncbi:MAG: hypothetical protein KBD37_00175 [Burkholderiales bacterium]|nr:hypothetical protein [Burkholderiales bacterium]